MELPNATKYYEDELKDWHYAITIGAPILFLFFLYCCVFRPIRDCIRDCSGFFKCICYLPIALLKCLCCCNDNDDDEPLLS